MRSIDVLQHSLTAVIINMLSFIYGMHCISVSPAKKTLLAFTYVDCSAMEFRQCETESSLLFL